MDKNTILSPSYKMLAIKKKAMKNVQLNESVEQMLVIFYDRVCVCVFAITAHRENISRILIGQTHLD